MTFNVTMAETSCMWCMPVSKPSRIRAEQDTTLIAYLMFIGPCIILIVE